MLDLGRKVTDEYVRLIEGKPIDAGGSFTQGKYFEFIFKLLGA